MTIYAYHAICYLQRHRLTRFRAVLTRDGIERLEVKRP